MDPQPFSDYLSALSGHLELQTLFVSYFCHIRADCVYAGFGSPSAFGGDVLSGTKTVCLPLEKPFGESSAGSTNRHRFNALHHNTDGILVQHQVS